MREHDFDDGWARLTRVARWISFTAGVFIALVLLGLALPQVLIDDGLGELRAEGTSGTLREPSETLARDVSTTPSQAR